VPVQLTCQGTANQRNLPIYTRFRSKGKVPVSIVCDTGGHELAEEGEYSYPILWRQAVTASSRSALGHCRPVFQDCRDEEGIVKKKLHATPVSSRRLQLLYGDTATIAEEIIMAVTYSWGHWEERWLNGQFQCVFVEVCPQSDGLIHASGLYRAVDGDTLNDIDTFQEAIEARSAIVADARTGVLVKSEFAELLAIMPAFLDELAERLTGRVDPVEFDEDFAWRGPAPLVRRESALTDRQTCHGCGRS
jgi:hypothetical protein